MKSDGRNAGEKKDNSRFAMIQKHIRVFEYE